MISDEIKGKLDIVEVIREYAQLKPAGTNFQALCPFHNEKTPSFLVSPEKQIWHCFGCGKGGDVFAFVMEKEGLTFVEALRFLAPKAGVVLSAGNASGGSMKTRALDVLDLAAGFYHKNLLENPGAGRAREYLEGRGLTREVIVDWRLGYSSDSWDDLLNWLKSKGFNEREIDAAGLASRGSGGNRFYNRFRGRIMFPIRDAQGQTVGFTARQLPGSDDKMGKYINSPASIIYDKSKILFGLDKAKSYIRESGVAVLMEGQMDVITAHQFGFKNTIASSGTALSEEQLNMLKRFASTVILALDSDRAGQDAAEKVGELADSIDSRFEEHQDRYGKLRRFIDPRSGLKLNFKVAVSPLGKDPDEAIRKSPEDWQEALAKAVSLPEFYFLRSIADLDLEKLDDRKKAAGRFLPFVARLDPIDRDFWIRRLSAVIDTDAKYLYEALSAAVKSDKRQAVKQETSQNAHQSHEEKLSASLIALLLKFNAYIKYILDYVRPEQMRHQEYQSLYRNIIIYYNEKHQSNSNSLGVFELKFDDFKGWLSGKGLSREAKTLERLSILAERDYFAYTDNQADADIKNIARELKRHWLNSRRREVSRLIGELESNKSAESVTQIEGLIKELANLNEELRRLL